MNQAKRKSVKGRVSIANQKMEKLKRLGIFRSQEIKTFGISQATLSRLVSKGQILRMATNLYIHPQSRLPAEDRDFAAACKKFGDQSVIGGMSALFHYGLIEQVPRKIWIIIPYEKKTTDPFYQCIRTKTSANIGVDKHEYYKITNLERTLVEAFRYSSKMGLRVATKALRTAINKKSTTLEKVVNLAKTLGLQSSIEKYWEILIPEAQGDI